MYEIGTTLKYLFAGGGGRNKWGAEKCFELKDNTALRCSTFINHAYMVVRM